MTKWPVLAIVLFLSLPCLLMAQEAEEVTPTAKTAKVRGWLFPCGDKEPVMLAVKLADDSEMLSLASTKEGLSSSVPGYAEVALGGTVMVELKSGEQVISSQSIALREDRHYTLVSWKEGGRWQFRAFADDPSPVNAPDRPLRVLNFADGRKTAVSLAGGVESMIKADSVEELRAPARVIMVAAKVQSLDGGPPAQSSVEVDFSSMPSAYVVVGPDYRGRMRPRVTAGGASPSEEAPPSTDASEQ
jgi:hypothetical protein